MGPFTVEWLWEVHWATNAYTSFKGKRVEIGANGRRKTTIFSLFKPVNLCAIILFSRKWTLKRMTIFTQISKTINLKLSAKKNNLLTFLKQKWIIPNFKVVWKSLEKFGKSPWKFEDVQGNPGKIWKKFGDIQRSLRKSLGNSGQIWKNLRSSFPVLLLFTVSTHRARV